MTLHFPTFRTHLARLLAGLALIAPLAVPPLAAQTIGYPALADADPVTALSRYLRMLAANPRDLASLTGAGKAALAVGDANAALGFYARAEEIAPRNGRVKAGLATALVQMEQPRAALKLFDEAVALGVPAGEIAADRGLANDLNGDGRRAQADYTIALRAHDDDETVRRLALSMAVSGDRDGALAVLSPLLRRRDSGAERARAFVLALTGDQAGAANAVRTAMPGPQATVMTSFMTRLARLNPAQKALAVNFGYFPSDGRSYTAAELFADARAAPLPSSGSAIGQRDPRRDLRGDTPLIPAGEALGPRIARDEVVSAAPRRRPGEAAEVLPPPHVLSAPIPGVTPPTTAMGVAETRVALAQSGMSVMRHQIVTPAARQDTGVTPAAGGPVVAAQSGAGIPTATMPVMTPSTPVAASPLPPSVPAASAGVAPAPGFDILTTTTAPVASAARIEAAPRSRPSVATALSANAPVIVTATGPALAAASHRPATRVAVVSPAVKAAAAGEQPAKAAPTKAAPTTARTSTRTERFARAEAERDQKTTATKAETPAAADRKGRATKDGKGVKLAALDPNDAKPAGEGGTKGMKRKDARGRKGGDEAEDVVVEKGAKADKGLKTGKGAKDAKTGRGSTAARETDDDAADEGAKGTKTGRGAKAGRGSKSLRDTGTADDGKTVKDTKGTDDRAKTKTATPERYWVQVASGSNKASLDKAWDTVKGKAPKLLAGQTTHTAPWKASNRLLIGPFKSEADAQAKVNALAKAGVSGIQFTTRAGADVEKVGAK